MYNWFECKVSYEKINDSGLPKRQSESYLVDAYTVTEAEARLVEELTPFTSSGDFVINNIKRAKIADLFLSQEESADRYYRAKIFFISIDEKNGVEKRTPATMIVQAASLPDAVTTIQKEMGAGVTDYQIGAIGETTIMDVFFAGKKE